ncbi:metallophosphoesterase family protein [Jiangella asiatica]|uniref:Metallophosphoesterase family protein n=1 Tax=Jiangella asiatica TaxID=2530372 RepID=A0A4V2YZZ3_9ACTN|nr:metallophosphoesterase family protein [Jiangella asiatica]
MRSRRGAGVVVGAALLGGGLVVVPAAVGADSEPPTQVPAAEIYEPSAMPDRIILTPTTTPATSQKVSWRSEVGGEWAQAQILEAPIALGGVQPPADAVRTVMASSTSPVNTSLGYASVYHQVEFTGLTPNTRYTYRVGDGVNWSEWTDFTTASEAFEPFSFIYYGDAQNYIDSAVPRVFRQAFADRPEAKVIVNAGDLINSANSEEEWGQWHAADGFINSQVNNISVPGNHEYSGGQLSTFWQPQFPFPDNGPDFGDEAVNAALRNTIYYVDYQGVRFIGLNTNIQGDAALMATQTAWLDQTLASNPHKWTVVTFHHPVYSTASGRNNPVVRGQWGPLLEEYGVDLVLQGHDHTYGRGSVSSSRKSATVHDSTVYAVSVSGGKMYDVDGSVWTDNGADIMNKAQDAQLYQMIDVTEDSITYEARYANGEHHDGVVIRKNDAGERTVQEIRTPENTVGEQVVVDRTEVEFRGTVGVQAWGYDPGETVNVYIRNPERGQDVLVGEATADELGRVTTTAQMPSSARRQSQQVVYLESVNQQITGPEITILR